MGCNRCQCVPCCCSSSTCDTYNCSEICSILNVKDSWNVPACDASAVLYAPGIRAVLVGSYIWNPNYGYFLVTAINPSNSQITVKNQCLPGNIAAGSVIPANSSWILTSAPASAPGSGAASGIFPYLALDFVAPGNGICIDITVTNVNGLYVGQTVSLGGGEYRIGDIPDSTTLNICNDGSGITPGTGVSAKNSSGYYQYPITGIIDCCATVGAMEEWEDFSLDVTYSASAGMNVTVPVTSGFTYVPIGGTVAFEMGMSATLTGVAGSVVKFLLPIQGTPGIASSPVLIQNGGADEMGAWRVSADGLYGEVFRVPIFAWTLGAISFSVKSFYRKA